MHRKSFLLEPIIWWGRGVGDGEVVEARQINARRRWLRRPLSRRVNEPTVFRPLSQVHLFGRFPSERSSRSEPGLIKPNHSSYPFFRPLAITYRHYTHHHYHHHDSSSIVSVDEHRLGVDDILKFGKLWVLIRGFVGAKGPARQGAWSQ